MTETPNREWRIGIVGAGFTGALLAVHLIHLARVPTRILLFDRTGRFGPGLAYRTGDRSHLLNVRAANMSAFPDRPDHFLRWLAPLDPGADAAGAVGQAFVTRGEYGRYLQDLLETARRQAPGFVRMEPVTAEIVDLEGGAGDHQLVTADGHRHTVDHTILCLGNFPPQPPAIDDMGFFARKDAYLGNPWDNAALGAVAADRPALILGSGLTMVDVVLTLAHQGHRAPLVVLSNRGLLPAVHRPVQPWPDFIAGRVVPSGIVGLTALIRAQVRQAAAAGIDWRAVIDSLRPHLPALWRSLSEVERRRFLRHLRPYWDIHRHRMAPAAAATLHALLEDGRLRLVRGRLLELVRRDAKTLATVRPRHRATPELLTTDLVINATGLAMDVTRLDDALVVNLLGRGAIRPDALGIGLDVTDECALIGRDGRPTPGLFALGPLTRGAWWEITAVPELRNQAVGFARTLTVQR